MTYAHNEPTDFRTESIAGMVGAFPALLVETPGGVISATTPEHPRVATVVGGGSGHYPAFGGMVGAGMADAAVLGDIFASPSASQVAQVGRAADQGHGILLLFGNYTGDVLNFSAGAQLLRGEGFDVRLLAVTDDIASAPLNERHQRRGIAGDLAVFKVAGAAANRGCSLDEVEQLARRANDHTRTLGVAYTGCTLPGADQPLFELPAGTMGIGMGIHGEPGLETIPRQPGGAVARMLVEKVLADLSESGIHARRVVPVINGLGGISADELFIVYDAVAQELGRRNVRIASPLVGTFCSSFDMAGFSVTLLAADDDELLSLWDDPVETAAWRRGSVTRSDQTRRITARSDDTAAAVGRSLSAADTARAHLVASVMQSVAAELDRIEPELGRLDAVAGDGDHGIGMARGSAAAATAATDAAHRGFDAADTLMAAASAWADRAGGTSGAIWGAMLSRSAQALSGGGAIDTALIAETAGHVTGAVRSMGGAGVGDKTIVDVLVPFSDSLASSAAMGEPLEPAWRRATEAAAAAAQRTSEMSARRGRARSHGTASQGTPDPGCVSFAAVAATVAAAVVKPHAETSASG